MHLVGARKCHCRPQTAPCFHLAAACAPSASDPVGPLAEPRPRSPYRYYPPLRNVLRAHKMLRLVATLPAHFPCRGTCAQTEPYTAGSDGRKVDSEPRSNRTRTRHISDAAVVHPCTDSRPLVGRWTDTCANLPPAVPAYDVRLCVSDAVLTTRKTLLTRSSRLRPHRANH